MTCSFLAVNQHCTVGILSTVNGFRSGEKQMLPVVTGDGESLSWFLKAWPPCSVSRKKHQGQQLFPKEGLLESEFL